MFSNNFFNSLWQSFGMPGYLRSSQTNGLEDWDRLKNFIKTAKILRQLTNVPH
ncbi:hypothetical protein HDC92_001307 [Pedobacter sp. AK017]|nr:hypothetical protein [Pedobacter sp. AK017]